MSHSLGPLSAACIRIGIDMPITNQCLAAMFAERDLKATLDIKRRWRSPHERSVRRRLLLM